MVLHIIRGRLTCCSYRGYLDLHLAELPASTRDRLESLGATSYPLFRPDALRIPAAHSRPPHCVGAEASTLRGSVPGPEAPAQKLWVGAGGAAGGKANGCGGERTIMTLPLEQARVLRSLYPPSDVANAWGEQPQTALQWSLLAATAPVSAVTAHAAGRAHIADLPRYFPGTCFGGQDPWNLLCSTADKAAGSAEARCFRRAAEAACYQLYVAAYHPVLDANLQEAACITLQLWTRAFTAATRALRTLLQTKPKECKAMPVTAGAAAVDQDDLLLPLSHRQEKELRQKPHFRVLFILAMGQQKSRLRTRRELRLTRAAFMADIVAEVVERALDYSLRSTAFAASRTARAASVALAAGGQSFQTTYSSSYGGSSSGTRRGLSPSPRERRAASAVSTTSSESAADADSSSLIMSVDSAGNMIGSADGDSVDAAKMMTMMQSQPKKSLSSRILMGLTGMSSGSGKGSSSPKGNPKITSASGMRDNDRLNIAIESAATSGSAPPAEVGKRTEADEASFEKSLPPGINT